VEYLRNLRVEMVSLASLKPHARNPRTHSPKQVRQIADSIRKFGFVTPILIDPNGGVIAGHGRIEAAKLLGIDTVPRRRSARTSWPTTSSPRTPAGTRSCSRSS
jgi:hypothetical protein